MDIVDRYKIQESIDDAIGILDSAPIKLDLLEELNIVQLANRMSQRPPRHREGAKGADRRASPTKRDTLSPSSIETCASVTASMQTF